MNIYLFIGGTFNSSSITSQLVDSTVALSRLVFECVLGN